MSIKCESIEQSLLLQYERVFFEEICGLDTTGRESLSVPLDSPLDTTIRIFRR